MKQFLEKPVLYADASINGQTACEKEYPLTTPTIHPSPLTGEWAEYAWCSSREASEILMKAESAILMASELGDEDHNDDEEGISHEDDMAHSDEHKSVTQEEFEEKVHAPLSVDQAPEEITTASNSVTFSNTIDYGYGYAQAATSGDFCVSYHSVSSTAYTSHDPYLERSSTAGYYSSASSMDVYNNADYIQCTSGDTSGYPCYCATCYALPPAPLPTYHNQSVPSMSHQPSFVSSYPRVDSYSAQPQYAPYDGSELASYSNTMSSEYAPDAGTPSFVHHYRDGEVTSRRRKSTRFPVPPPPTKTRTFVQEEPFYHAMMRWYAHIHDWDISKPPCPPPLHPTADYTPDYSYEEWLVMVEEWYHTHFSNTRRPVRPRH